MLARLILVRTFIWACILKCFAEVVAAPDCCVGAEEGVGRRRHTLRPTAPLQRRCCRRRQHTPAAAETIHSGGLVLHAHLQHRAHGLACAPVQHAALDRAFRYYKETPERWAALRGSIMSDAPRWSWDTAAGSYVDLYQQASQV